MPAFGKTSKRQLSTIHPKLQLICRTAIRRWDFSVVCGHRSVEDQQAAYAAGRSMLDGVTKKSAHNYTPARAVDLVPYWKGELCWHDRERILRFVEYIRGIADALNIPIRLGADWDGDTDLTDQTFNDRVHFELVL